MQYLLVFAVVFTAIGLRGLQQKVVQANRYVPMGIVGVMIYLMEGTAILTIARGDIYHVVLGALGAGAGVVTFVFVYNKLAKKT